MTTGPDTDVAAEVPKRLLLAVAGLAAAALVLGLLILVLQLRPAATPTTPAQRAVAAWEQTARAQPDSDRAHAGLGEARFAAGQLPEARAAFEAALDRDPENWFALQRLGILLMEDDADRAVQLLRTSAELAPRANRAPALLALGELQLERGDAEGARASYEAAIGDLPFLMDGHLGLARALEVLGDVEGARAARERASRYGPGRAGSRDTTPSNQEPAP